MSELQKQFIRTLIYGFVNVLIPLISVFISIRFPDTKFECAVVSLLLLCWLNSVVLICEFSKIVAINKSEANRMVEAARKHFDQAFGQLHEEVTCLATIQDDTTLERLKSMSKLHNELSKRNRLCTSYDYINLYPINHHLRNYVDALHRAFHDLALPLPSEPRMEVAIRTIQRAKSVIAVNTYNDQWYDTDNSVYQQANLDAARASVKIKRVFVFRGKTELNRLSKILQAQIEAGIDVRVLLQDRLDRSVHSKFPIENILICDNEVMTHSLSREKHDGYLVLNKDEIEKYTKRFHAIWELAESYSHYINKFEN